MSCMYITLDKQKSFSEIITITTFPVWDIVDVGLPKGCTGAVVAAVVVACDVVPAICMRLPLRFITVSQKSKVKKSCLYENTIQVVL